MVIIQSNEKWVERHQVTMPYGNRKGYRAKRRPTKRRRTSAPSTGAALLAALKGYALTALKRKLGLNTETKYVDVAGSSTATATLASRIVSPTIPQGATVGGRNGAGVRVTKVEQRINIEASAAATKGCNVRIITVRHRHSGVPAVADILQVTTDFSSPIHNNIVANHVEIISDQTYTVGTATSENSTVLVSNMFSRANWQMEWTDADTTGVPANLINGAIVTLWMVDNVTTAPTFTSTNRVWFVDN